MKIIFIWHLVIKETVTRKFKYVVVSCRVSIAYNRSVKFLKAVHPDTWPDSRRWLFWVNSTQSCNLNVPLPALGGCNRTTPFDRVIPKARCLSHAQISRWRVGMKAQTCPVRLLVGRWFLFWLGMVPWNAHRCWFGCYFGSSRFDNAADFRNVRLPIRSVAHLQNRFHVWLHSVTDHQRSDRCGQVRRQLWCASGTCLRLSNTAAVRRTVPENSPPSGVACLRKFAPSGFRMALRFDPGDVFPLVHQTSGFRGWTTVLSPICNHSLGW